MSNVIHLPQRHYSIYELFMNMNKTQGIVNQQTTKTIKDLTECVDILNRRQKGLIIAFVIALILAIAAGGIGTSLAIKKIKKTPVTVYVQGYNHTVDIDKLPIAPLEEIK